MFSMRNARGKARGNARERDTVIPEVSYGTGDSVTNVFNEGWVTARRSAATKIKWLASCSPCNPLCGLEIP